MNTSMMLHVGYAALPPIWRLTKYQLTNNYDNAGEQHLIAGVLFVTNSGRQRIAVHSFNARKRLVSSKDIFHGEEESEETQDQLLQTGLWQ